MTKSGVTGQKGERGFGGRYQGGAKAGERIKRRNNWTSRRGPPFSAGFREGNEERGKERRKGLARRKMFKKIINYRKWKGPH